jgi:uncharacterized Zn-binding protein involved in type VI secretion
MATIAAPGNLQNAQTGNADSTNVIQDTKATFVDTGKPAVIRIVSTIGATPTVTVQILGSQDGVTFTKIPYALSGTPTVYTTADITITTATTAYYNLRPGLAWQYVKLNMAANTNVTLTSDYL